MGMAGDLFQDLPPPIAAAQSHPSSINNTLQESAPKPPPAPALKSALKRPKPPPEAGPEKRIRFKTTTDASEKQVIEAMQKITSHIKNPSKFNKASKLAIQLIQAGSIKEATSDYFFSVLEAAMLSMTTCNEPSLRDDYCALFSAAQDVADCLSKKQKNMLTAWTIRSIWANDLFTDDSFVEIVFDMLINGQQPSTDGQLLKALVVILSDNCNKKSQRAYTELSQFPDFMETEMLHILGIPSKFCKFTAPKFTLFSKSTGRIKEAISSLPVATEDDDIEEAVALKGEITEVASADAEENKEEEPDPFGLDALISKDEKSKSKKEALSGSKKDDEEEKRFLKSQREALISCLEIAAKRYKTPWCQTAIDILAKHAFDNISRFTKHQRDAIQKLWASIREQQTRRKQGKSVSGKLDVNGFEWLQHKYSTEKISIRHSVGGSGDRRCQQWLG